MPQRPIPESSILLGALAGANLAAADGDHELCIQLRRRALLALARMADEEGHGPGEGYRRCAAEHAAIWRLTVDGEPLPH